MRNQRGQSLVQVLVSVAIMGILMAAMATMQTSQQRENRALGEKLNALDLQRSMSQALTNGSLCTYMLTHPVVTVNTAAVASGTPQVQSLTIPFYASMNGTTPGPVLAQVGPASAPNTLPISSISLTVSSGAGTAFIGSIDANFDQSKLTRSLRSASAGVALTVDASGKVTSCAGTGGGGALSNTEDGNVNLTPGSGNKLTTPSVTLNHGIYFVDYYNCIVGPKWGGADYVSADYFQQARAEALSGTIFSGFFNFQFSDQIEYGGNSFILKVTSPSATVQFVVQHMQGGTITYGSQPCSSFLYTKLSN